MKRQTPSEFKRHWSIRARWLNEILAALDGEKVYWSDGERSAAYKIAGEFGFTLITKSAARRKGFELRKGSQPIGMGYFTSPIAAHHDIYILECHFDKVEG